VLDGRSVVLRSKVDPSAGAVKLSSTIGRRNPAHCTAVGKLLLSYLSQFLVLEPGDLIDTGTPPGVAMGMKPPVWLVAGDVMELAIDGLGTQRQTVIAPR
jgi:hypothetical protein